MYGCGVDVTVCILKEEMEEEELVTLIGGGLGVVKRDSREVIYWTTVEHVGALSSLWSPLYSYYCYYYIYISSRVWS